MERRTAVSDNNNLNERGNHQGEFTQGVGGWAEYTVHMTETADKARHDITVPPDKIIPIIFLPGVMGSNLRMSKKRQDVLKRPDNRAWRPDDLMSLSGNYEVVNKSGMGGWFRNASPAQRQLDFDPNTTEVEYYHYTESKDRFDPEGKETLEADARHQNVPDTLAPIPPLMGYRFTQSISQPGANRTPPRKKQMPAQIARWRGWSEVLFAGPYSQMLNTAEIFLNNMVVKGQLNPMWSRVLTDPKSFGATSIPALTEVEIKKISNCWYPVHAMGYNYLKSNGESAVVIADRIRGLVLGYQKRGFKCDEVIIVTHSMGGILARALIHPDYGNLLSDQTVKVLGMYHSAMPTLGAAAAYRRTRFGFLEKEGKTAEYFAEIIAINGQHATAILANTPGPLELMPAAAYGKDWLKVIDGCGRTIRSWPQANENALDSIYLQPQSNWWRLINPDWVNPGNVRYLDGGGIENVWRRLKSATAFLDAIATTFHPTHCYASYCASDEHKSYGNLVFKVTNPEIWDSRTITLPPADTWKLLTDDKKGTLTVQAGTRVLTLKLQPGGAAGDETVPAERSACKITGTLFKHGTIKGEGYEHQGSYAHPHVLTSMLYSIAKIATTARWG
jgi:pimeloyl-ACP methyl ester carboxylesterase